MTPKTKKPKPFGERLRELREAKGWSREDLARLAGLNASLLVKWERDSPENASHWRIARVAAALGVSVGELAGDGQE